MRQSEGSSSRYRLWVGILVAAAVVAILAMKAYDSQRGAVPDPFDASVLAVEAEVDPLGSVLSDAKGNEAWPSSPSEQVLWALRHKQPAMILFYSTRCRQCQMMQSLVQVVKHDYQPDVVFVEVLIEDPANEAILRWAKVGTTPASYFLTRSGESKRVIGLMKQADLRAALARIAASD